MLIILLGAASGLARGSEHTLGDDAIDSLWIYPGETTIPHEGTPIGRPVRFDEDDLAALEAVVPEIEAISGRLHLRDDVTVTAGDRRAFFEVDMAAAERRELLFYRLSKVAEERVCKTRDEEADGVAALHPQARRAAVVHVVQLPRRGQHPVACRGGDERTALKDEGGGRPRVSRDARHVLQGRGAGVRSRHDPIVPCPERQSCAGT